MSLPVVIDVLPDSKPTPVHTQNLNVQVWAAGVQVILQIVEVPELGTAVDSRCVAKIPRADLSQIVSWRHILAKRSRRWIYVGQREIRHGQ